MPLGTAAKCIGRAETVVLPGEAMALGVGLDWVEGPFRLCCWALGSS